MEEISNSVLDSVNEIFDPANVDEFYSLTPTHRKQSLRKNKATNYSVVRLPLLEHMYEKMYRQRLLNPDPSDWKFSLYPNSEVSGAQKSDSNNALKLQLRNTLTGELNITEQVYDLIILATGYQRKPFSGILKELRPLMLPVSEDNEALVQRNYRLLFRPGSVVRDAAVWMQGSCETTHGVSFFLDTPMWRIINRHCLDKRHPSLYSCCTSGRTTRFNRRL